MKAVPNTEYKEYADFGGPEGIDAYDAAEAEQFEAIARAENAWLVAAEASTPEDEAFEAWERGRGCHMDPQSGYNAI